MSRTSWNPDEPWDRQPWDDDLGWAAFSEYLSQPVPRRFQSLRVGLTVHQLEEIAKRCRWHARVSLWDDYIARKQRETIKRVAVETAEDMTRRHIASLRRIQVLADREFENLERNPSELSARDAARLLTLGIKMEREIVNAGKGLTQPGDSAGDLASRMKDLSTEELRTLREIQKRLGCS